MADMTRIKGRIAETIYPNGTGAITAESHQALLLEMVDTINSEKADQSELVATQESLEALTDTVNNLPQGGGDVKADGVYPDLTAGDLAGRGESVPASFGFRASGGKSIKDGKAYIKRIKGNSVVWNNMVDTRGYEGEFIIRDGVTIIAGHKYLLMREKADGYLHLIPVVDGTENYDMILLVGEYGKIYTSQYTDTTDARVYGTTNMGGCIVSDLTQMFGAGYEPTTIDEYNARVATLGIDPYAYNEGQVIHCNTESIKSVGDNAWDEEWERGDINLTTGEKYDSNDYVRTKNPIKVIPNETYVIDAISSGRILFYDNMNAYIGKSDAFGNTTKITMPNNCHYIMYRWEDTTYNHDIMIRLDHSGWKNEVSPEYQPYWQDTLPLPIIRKYFPDGMKLAGSAHDEIRYNKATKKWEYSKGKIKSVDLGSLEWDVASNNRMIATSLENVIVRKDAANDTLLCAKYTNAYPSEVYLNTSDRIICSTNVGHIFVYDSAYTDAATFKAAMQGVILYYEAAEWEWVELDAEDQNFRDYYQVADFGTEQSQSNVPSAALSADIIYQFNAVDMIREHELEITELQKVIATMQAQLTSLINGGQ